jgi:hypothetical protein
MTPAGIISTFPRDNVILRGKELYSFSKGTMSRQGGVQQTVERMLRPQPGIDAPMKMRTPPETEKEWR